MRKPPEPPVELTCETCQQTFKRHVSEIKTGHQYCSVPCRYAGASFFRSLPNTQCHACHKPLHVAKRLLRPRNYCNHACAHSVVVAVTVVCDVCDVSFEKDQHHVRHVNYCSVRCASRAQYRRKRGRPINDNKLKAAVVKPPKPSKPLKPPKPEKEVSLRPMNTSLASPIDFLLKGKWNHEQHAIRADDGVDEYPHQGVGQHEGA